jgi:hypothetical protein
MEGDVIGRILDEGMHALNEERIVEAAMAILALVYAPLGDGKWLALISCKL